MEFGSSSILVANHVRYCTLVVVLYNKDILFMLMNVGNTNHRLGNFVNCHPSIFERDALM